MTQALIDDDLWTRIEPLLPKRRRRNRQYAGRKPIPDRAVLTGILFVLRSGIPWNMLPHGDGLRVRHDLLAAARALATRRRLEAAPSRCCSTSCGDGASSIWRARSSTVPRSARCAGEKNWTEPYRSPQGRVETSCSHRRARDSARRAPDGREPARRHAAAAARRRDADAPRVSPAGPCANPDSSKATAATIRSRIATSSRSRGIASAARQARDAHTAAASAAPAGSSNAPSPGCIAFAVSPSATSVGPVFTRRFSP